MVLNLDNFKEDVFNANKLDNNNVSTNKNYKNLHHLLTYKIFPKIKKYILIRIKYYLKENT